VQQRLQGSNVVPIIGIISDDTVSRVQPLESPANHGMPVLMNERHIEYGSNGFNKAGKTPFLGGARQPTAKSDRTQVTRSSE
jgi:hypothetical protein